MCGRWVGACAREPGVSAEHDQFGHPELLLPSLLLQPGHRYSALHCWGIHSSKTLVVCVPALQPVCSITLNVLPLTECPQPFTAAVPVCTCIAVASPAVPFTSEECGDQ